MSLRISFELSDADLAYFHQVMRRVCACNKPFDRQQVIDKAVKLLEEIEGSGATEFVRNRMRQLETLVDMLTDEGWGMAEDDCGRVMAALSYFSEPEDLIPDDVPVLGFLDDLIMTEIVCQELDPEIQAYREFVAFRESAEKEQYPEASSLQKDEWLEERRQQLHTRMRRRRAGRTGRESRSPFSLF